MQNDVFRFSALRPVEAKDNQGVDLIFSRRPGDRLTDLEEQIKTARTLKEILKIAEHFTNDHNRYVANLDAISPGFKGLNRALAHRKGKIDPSQLLDLAVQFLGHGFASRLPQWRTRVVESLFASIYLTEKVADRRELTRGLRIISLLEEIAGTDTTNKDEKSVQRLYSRVIALPRDVFPRLRNIGSAGLEEVDLYKEHQKKADEYKKNVLELTERLQDNKAARADLLKQYELDRLQKAKEINAVSIEDQGTPRVSTRRNIFVRALRSIGVASVGRGTSHISRVSNGPFTPTLSKRAIDKLQPKTLERLTSLGISTDFLSPSHAIRQLVSDSEETAELLYRGGQSGDVVLIGNAFVNEALLQEELAPVDFTQLIPGVCELPVVESPTLNSPTVPTGRGTYRSLGVMDLLVVRQRLLRYEKGEIAHIENVMRSELRSREHRRFSRREEFLLTERELEKETERDLESSERFELQRESEKTVQENASRQAGVTVTASYGPSIEVTANANSVGETAQSQSNRAAVAHAKDITDKSVERIQERVREERALRLINEIEEKNVHGFENSSDANITGIYRWVDKIYEAQVFDYGKRELLEFVVPEPAAFVRHALSSQPIEGLTINRPDPPGYCHKNRSEFVPLEPKHITPDSYKMWVAQYQAQNVNPPPEQIRILGTAFHQGWVTDDPKAVASSYKELAVPSGYKAKRAWSAGTHGHYPEDDINQPQMKIFVGRHEIAPNGDTPLDDEEGIIPIAILGLYLLVYGITVEVECHLMSAGLSAWQLETYSAIMTAYQEQKALYEEQRQNALVSATDTTIQGRNPLINREQERTELKKAVISQLTNQHFDDFDAMRRNVGRLGFPQADLDEASVEGQYIQFIEQAFEWTNMHYVFYPYFWGRKDDWPITSQLDDIDPLFGQFLRAGAARVNLPIRPGFESAVNTWLTTGVLPWSSDPRDTIITDDDLFLSIADEMKDQQGAVHLKTGGTISIVAGETIIQGNDTDFTKDDIQRDITIQGSVYRIKGVVSTTELELTTPYSGPDVVDGGYVIGAKAVGEPWTVRIPTSLVLLQPDDSLPDFTRLMS